MAVGSDPSNDIILPDPAVPSVVGCLDVAEDATARLERGFNPALRVPLAAPGQALELGDELSVGPFSLALISDDGLQASRPGQRRTRTRSEQAPSGQGEALELRHRDRVYVLEPPGRVTVGHRADCDIRLHDDFVSGIHCQLVFQANGWVVVDQGSRNGTFINGVQVDVARLPIPATLRVGESDLLVAGAANPEPEYENFYGLKAASPAMLKLFRRIERAARTADPVIVEGNTGVGKELISRAIHLASPRSRAPFVAVNCATLHPQLSGAELFGHRKGAFSGADRDRSGVFREATGGTLFLDEVAEIRLEVQSTLLRTLQESVVRPLGADAEVPIDVRTVAASHRNLGEAVREGVFREDLLHRLKTITLRVPPLRERREDIDVLAQHFLSDAPGVRLSGAAREKLLQHSWPGNVRELRNVLRCALAMRESDVIEPNDLEALEVVEPGPIAEASAPPVPKRRRRANLNLPEVRAATVSALESSGGVAAVAAQKLGISKGAMHYRMAIYGLLKKD